MKHLFLIVLLFGVLGAAGSLTIGGQHAFRGQKYVTGAGVVDINSVGQGVRIKADAAGITWTGTNLSGMTLTTESLVAANAGDYMVSWHASIDGTQGKNYLWEVVTDTDNDPAAGATAHDQCHKDASVEANTHLGVAGGCLITVAAGEYVYLAVQEPGAGAGTSFIMDHGGLVLTQH